jgi:hypothetical protein
MVGDVAFKCNETFSVISTASDPTQFFPPVSEIILDDDDINITVVTSNVSDGSTTSLESVFSSFTTSTREYAAMMIASNEAIADSGATQIFVTDGTRLVLILAGALFYGTVSFQKKTVSKYTVA